MKTPKIQFSANRTCKSDIKTSKMRFSSNRIIEDTLKSSKSYFGGIASKSNSGAGIVKNSRQQGKSLEMGDGRTAIFLNAKGTKNDVAKDLRKLPRLRG